MLVTMSDKELSRINVIQSVVEKSMRRRDAAHQLALTERQTQRLINGSCLLGSRPPQDPRCSCKSNLHFPRRLAEQTWGDTNCFCLKINGTS